MISNFSTDWYKDRLTDAELEELENPKPKAKPTKAGSKPPRRRASRPPRKNQPKPVDDSEEE